MPETPRRETPLCTKKVTPACAHYTCAWSQIWMNRIYLIRSRSIRAHMFAYTHVPDNQLSKVQPAARFCAIFPSSWWKPASRQCFSQAPQPLFGALICQNALRCKRSECCTCRPRYSWERTGLNVWADKDRGRERKMPAWTRFSKRGFQRYQLLSFELARSRREPRIWRMYKILIYSNNQVYMAIWFLNNFKW